MKLSKFTILIIALLLSKTAFSQQRKLSIHSIDFANRTYPWTADLIDPTNPQKTFTIRNGERPATPDNRGFIDQEGIFLEHVIYGDVTGDGVDDALVTMSIQTGGSAIPGLVYIYAVHANRPKLLWYFSTGDRADGGLHKVYAENGELVVELNGPKRRIEGDCCPMRFTRRRYVWRGNRFRQKGRKEIIPIPASQ